MSIQPIELSRKSKIVLQYRVLEDGIAKDLTGLTPKFSSKLSAKDTEYKIAPIDGVLSATTGEFSITLEGADTDLDPYKGVFSVVLIDGTGEKTPLTPVGGINFEIFDDIYDG